MYAKTYYKAGDWNQECDGCGFIFKHSQLRKDWQGHWMCPGDWDPKPPQELRQPKLKGTIPAKHVNQSSKQAMEDDYDADDHTIVFENDQVVNPNQP